MLLFLELFNQQHKRHFYWHLNININIFIFIFIWFVNINVSKLIVNYFSNKRLNFIFLRNSKKSTLHYFGKEAFYFKFNILGG